MKSQLLQSCFVICLIFCAGHAVGQGTDPLKPKILSLAFVYSGSAALPGWTAQHELARQSAASFFGDKVNIKTFDNIKPGADAERILIGLARDGTDLIFVTDPALDMQASEAAKRFPERFFEFATGKSDLENVSTYNGRFYQAYFIFGQIAAALSASHKIGFVAEMQNPSSMRAINAYMLGAQSVSRAVQTVVSFAGDAASPEAQANATRRVIEAGADVLSYHTHSPAPAQVAEQNGVWVFGSGADMSAFAPQRQVSSVNYDWSGYYINRIQLAQQGAWKKTDTWSGFDEGIVSVGDFIHVSDKIRDRAIETRQGFIDRTLAVFNGPIKDQAGAEKAKPGQQIDDATLQNMDWFVEGNLVLLPKQ